MIQEGEKLPLVTFKTRECPGRRGGHGFDGYEFRQSVQNRLVMLYSV